MSKPILIESKTVFVPRGTATYTPKWSIVVLAVACLGVLKFNGPGAKTSAARQTFERKPAASETPAPLPAPIETKSQVDSTPKVSGMETNSTGPANAAQLRDKNKIENQ